MNKSKRASVSNKLALFAGMLGLGLLLNASACFAASPVGYWDGIPYIEPNLTQGTLNKMCFLSDGTWYSVTYPGAGGEWFQKGDRIRVTAYSPQNGWNHALFGQFASNTEIIGEFIGFLNTPASGSIAGSTTMHPVTAEKGNFTLTFTSSICAPNPF